MEPAIVKIAGINGLALLRGLVMSDLSTSVKKPFSSLVLAKGWGGNSRGVVTADSGFMLN
jgi:hypothetical protein